MADKKRTPHHMPEQAGQTVVSYVFSFLLSIMLVILTALVIIKACCFTESVFLRLIDKDYYQYTLNDIEESSVDYTLPTGFDISVIDNVFTLEETERDVKGYASAAYRGTEYEPDLSGPEEKLTANVRELYTGQNAEITEETEQIISSYVKAIMDVYKYGVRMPGLDLILKGRPYFERIFLAAFLGSLIMALVLVMLCIKIHHYVHRGLRYVAYACGAAAVMLFALPMYLYVTKMYERVSLHPQYFYHFVVTFLSRLLITFFFGALLWLLVCILLIVCISIKRNHLRHR